MLIRLMRMNNICIPAFKDPELTRACLVTSLRRKHVLHLSVMVAPNYLISNVNKYINYKIIVSYDQYQ